MKFITRKQLLNRTWSATDLDAAAEFWLRLYEAAAGKQGFTARPDHVTEVRLRGFPRAEGPLLRDELARRATLSDFYRPVVELRDPDTLVLTSGVTHPADSPPVGLGLPLLEGIGFDGLMVEFRVSATGGQHQLVGRSRVSFTLVLVGQVVGGAFVLQTLWRAGSTGWEDDLCWNSGWLHAAEWLAALERFRETGDVPPKLAKAICIPRGAENFGAVVTKLLNVPFDKPRFVGLAWRVLVFVLVLGTITGGMAWLALRNDWIGFGFLVVTTWWIFAVFGLFVVNELRLWFTCYRVFHDLYATLYREPHRLVPAPAELAAEMAQNVTVRKYTADLEAAKFALAGDLVIDPQSFDWTVFRVFRAPDGVTHLALVFVLPVVKNPAGFYTWPAQVTFLAHTVFADGGYAMTFSGRGNGYRRKRTGPEVLARILPDEKDPLAFVGQHMRFATEFAEQGGRRVLPNRDFTEYARRQNEMLEDEQRYFVGSPYTWGDHLWWYLQSPRRVFRG